MAKFTRRNFIKASVATGIVAGAVAAPALVSPFRRSVLATGSSSAAPLPQAITAMSSTFNLNGTPHIPALYACQPGLEIIGKVGVKKIREKSMRQTERLVAGALKRGWRVNSPREAAERGGTVSVECPHAKEVKSELIERNVMVDYRPGAGVRLSPHFYNRDEEIDFALAQIEEILATRSWERHLQPA